MSNSFKLLYVTHFSRGEKTPSYEPAPFGPLVKFSSWWPLATSIFPAGANSGEILFYQLESTRNIFLLKRS